MCSEPPVLAQPDPEEDRERLLREIHRLQLYRECESIQGSGETGCDLQLFRLRAEYERRFGPVPLVPNAPCPTPPPSLQDPPVVDTTP